jgi:hypothetical protein
MLLVGVGLILAALYANPGIAKFGPSNVYPVDAGGLRPTMGAQPYRIEVLGYPVYESKKKKRPGQAPPSGAEPEPPPMPDEARPAEPQPPPQQNRRVLELPTKQPGGEQ